MKNNNKSYRILNLEGAWFTENENGEFIFATDGVRKFKDKSGKIIEIKQNPIKLFTATMPYSLETYRAFNILPKEAYKEGNDQFTKLFVNFKFTKDLFDDNSDDDIVKKINKKKLRKLIYTSVVKIDGVEYCFFKRGASKARTANVIFCKKEYCDKLLQPSFLGLKFTNGNKYDVTSKEAYTSLIMSGIIGTIEIKAEEILIINDIMSPSFKAKQTVTMRNEKGEVIQLSEKEVDVVNNMSDGQALMDEEKYIENEMLNKSTCALLRNDFLKANACRTRLQEYYSKNNITEVWDMYRGWIDASKIRLVITPSACKYLKFANQFESEKECFLDWLERIPATFGVVKTDHEGNYGYSNRLSYQMINSMNLSREDIKVLMQDELDYLHLLKDNVLETSEDIRKMTKKNKELNRLERNKMSYFLDYIGEKDELSTSDMVSDLLNRNSDFRFTEKFKNWKKNILQDYIDELRLGKIRIKNSLYAIMISCPFEMLVATTTENNTINSCIMDKWECYCPRFGDNEELMAIRNPQINAGNIGSVISKWHKEYKWFGYYEDGQAKHDFVVFVNTYNADLMNRLQGADFDIDSIFLTNFKLLVSKAKESQAWATPTNGIEGSKQLQEYDNKSLAKLDNYLGGSTMNIGKIVNKSAIFNAYMYHEMNTNNRQEYIDACYNASSTLSSFSQVAIDMAKKSFEGLSLTKEMNNLNKTFYVEDNKNINILKYEIDREHTRIIEESEYKEGLHIITRVFCRKNEDRTIVKKYEVHEIKMIVPHFFTYIAKDNEYRIPTKMECGMDYLEEILDDFKTKAMDTDKKEIQDLLVMQKDLSGKDFKRDFVDEIRKIVDECNCVVIQNTGHSDNQEESKKKKNLIVWAKNKAINEIKALIKSKGMNEKTVYRIIIRAFDLDKNYQGNEIKKLDKEEKEITYTNKRGEKVNAIVREFKEMTMLTLTLMYNAFPENFMKCFKKVKEHNVEVERFWE